MTLTERWDELWQDLGAHEESDKVLHELRRRYGETQRAYHTLAHIEHCLSELDAVLDTFADPRAAKLALWFHDAIYDPRRHDNEEQSIALLRQQMTRYTIAKHLVEQTARYIRATTHTRPGTSFDERTIIDVDLAILGQAPHVFDHYDAAIRQEYAFVPWEEYAPRRAQILRSFLARPTIYATEHFRERYEAYARHNLARAVARLEAQQ